MNTQITNTPNSSTNKSKQILIDNFDVAKLSVSSLNAKQLIELARELLPLYVSGFMHEEICHENQQEFFEDLLNHLRAADYITTLSKNGKMIAFICSQQILTNFGPSFGLGGIIVDNNFQGQSVGYHMLNMELLDSGANVLAFHTQSKRMLKLGMRCALIFDECAREIAKYFRHKKLDDLIDVGRYDGKPLYGNSKGLASIAITDINIERGDARFFAGFVRKAL